MSEEKRPVITFDAACRDRLRVAYDAHVKRMAAYPGTRDVFEFEGHPLVVGYAKYLLEYLDSRFKT